jgi:hypothetical protein
MSRPSSRRAPPGICKVAAVATGSIVTAGRLEPLGDIRERDIWRAQHSRAA